MREHDDHGAAEPARRDILLAASAIMLSGSAAQASALGVAAQTPNRDAAPLGVRLQGVQHFGLTVQNMERAFEFYTQVLGGTEVFRHGDFQGDAVQNTLLADQEIVANEKHVTPATIGVPDLRGGTQRLDVRFVQFDNVVIELLQYRNADEPVGSPHSFAEPVQHMSSAFPRMMHICFYVRDDVDFNKFIADLEAESVRRGMTQVRANRTIRVPALPRWSVLARRLRASIAVIQPDHARPRKPPRTFSGSRFLSRIRYGPQAGLTWIVAGPAAIAGAAEGRRRWTEVSGSNRWNGA